MHAGMDLGHTAGRGAPILNVQNGVVHEVLRDADTRRVYSGYGNGVIVHHPTDDTWALYAHMDRVDVQQGQTVAAGQRLGTMGASTNRKFPGMGVHLHIELRRRRPDGGAPFPGPYPQSVERPLYSLDPRPWLESKGLRFGTRGAFEVAPSSPMAATRHAWSNLSGLDGVDPYPEMEIAPWSRKFPETALGKVSTAPPDGDNAYEPVRFDRDLHFGLKPIEWGVIGAGTLVLVGTTIAVIARRRVARNPRRSRLRRRRSSRPRLTA
jgi:hypothetical protein